MASPYPGDSPNPFQENPYRSAEMNYRPQETLSVGTARLASVGQRFLGFLIDSMIPLVFDLPGYGMVIAGVIIAQQQEQNGIEPSVPWLSIIGGGLLGFGFIALLAIQIYLLATRSQTLGKYFLNIQIVDYETGRPADFVHCALLRILVNSLISGIPCIGFLYFIVDSCYIFRDDRRCIHDLIASTTVIDLSHS